MLTTRRLGSLFICAMAACGGTTGGGDHGDDPSSSRGLSAAKKKPICTVDSDPDTCGGSGSHACGEEEVGCTSVCLVGLTYNIARSVCVPCGAPGLLACGGSQCNPGLVNVGARCMQPDAMKAPELVLMCRFDETPDTAGAEGAARRLFLVDGSGKDNLFDYYAEMTYGRLDLSGSRVVGWTSLGSRSDPVLEATIHDRAAFYNACVAATQKANPTLDMTSYFRVLAVENVDFADDGAAGAAVTIAQDHLDTDFTAHEMGHAYGLSHAQDEALSACGGAPGDYCDPWDEMSAQLNYAHPAPGMRDRDGFPGANGFIAGQRVFLGANLGLSPFTTSEILTPAPGTTTTVTLAAVNHPEVAGIRVVEVPIDSASFYTVELVRNTGWDVGAPASRVLVHRIEAGRTKIVVSPSADKAWAAGMTCTHPGLVVKVVSIDDASSTAVVTVTRGT